MFLNGNFKVVLVSLISLFIFLFIKVVIKMTDSQAHN